jgi:dihydroorotate dehydrogenase (NAD+) catalytic subunit
MTFTITRSGKNTLELHTPVMCAAGTFGFGEVYRNFINIDKIGAIVTHPITYDGWTAARGPRVVPLDAGVLMHTGLPNPGLNKALRKYRNLWIALPLPIIVHLVATTPEHVRKSAARLDEEDGVDAIELGLADDLDWQEAETLVKAAVSKTDKPVLVRLPLLDAYEIAQPVADAGAGALVVSAPPRGTARDAKTGRLVSGRIYGPLVKPVVLHAVGRLVERIKDVPIIGAGGIHSAQDARDFIETGAVAVQVDSVTWIKPKLLETISRDLGGEIVTRETNALPDEWHEGMGDTEKQELEEVKKSTDEDAEDAEVS